MFKEDCLRGYLRLIALRGHRLLERKLLTFVVGRDRRGPTVFLNQDQVVTMPVGRAVGAPPILSLDSLGLKGLRLKLREGAMLCAIPS